MVRVDIIPEKAYGALRKEPSKLLNAISSALFFFPVMKAKILPVKLSGPFASIVRTKL